MLSVADNQLGGGIQCIDNLSSSLHKLRYLSLEGNRFTGFVSASFGDLPKLRIISLARNELTGGVPPSLTTLTELVRTP